MLTYAYPDYPLLGQLEGITVAHGPSVGPLILMTLSENPVW